MGEREGPVAGVTSDMARLSKRICVRLLAPLMRAIPDDRPRAAYQKERLYRWIGGGGFGPDQAVDASWRTGSEPRVRLRRSGYTLSLRPWIWSERRGVFFGDYYQRDIVELLGALVRPSDRVIDIGANIGFTVLRSARIVGPGGVVDAFEPNPEVGSRLRRTLDENALGWVRLHPCAVGAGDGTATLSYRPEHTGAGSLVREAAEGKHVEVKVRSARSVFEDGPADRPTIIKIDVEGFEAPVLRSLTPCLHDRCHAVIVEINPRLLAEQGERVEAIAGALAEKGLHAWLFRIARDERRSRLELARCAEFSESGHYDVLFADAVAIERCRDAGARVEGG